MDAGTARTSALSADSFFGSLISLTSKSEIRYQGIRHDLNLEKSNILLTNVRSFGTEGRRKDGPQVAPDDRIYEYILFRGSDIRDLQLITPPLSQTTGSIYNDPAIIQSHYPQVTSSSASMPLGPEFISSHSGPTQHTGYHLPTFQGNRPLCQSAGSLGSWVSSPQPTGISGLGPSMYWPSFHGYQNSFQPNQTLPQHRPGLSMLPTVQYPFSNGLLPGTSALQPSHLLQSSFPSTPSNISDCLNFHPAMLPAPPPSAFLPDPSPFLVPANSAAPSLANTTFNTTANSILLSPSTHNNISEIPSSLPVYYESRIASTSCLSSSSTSESLSSAVERSKCLPMDSHTQLLITPSQLLQLGPSSVSPLANFSNPPSTKVKEDQISSLASEAPMQAAHKPSLTLASSSDSKLLRAAPSYTQHNGGGIREGGRKKLTLHSVNKYTEEFDFEAMNEKFNKDKIWGDLGRSSRRKSRHDNNDTALSNYVKDDFFDTLSGDRAPQSGRAKDSLSGDRAPQSGRATFYERKKNDTFV